MLQKKKKKVWKWENIGTSRKRAHSQVEDRIIEYKGDLQFSVGQFEDSS